VRGQVVGIAADVVQHLWRGARPEIFVPAAQLPPFRATLMVGMAGDSGALKHRIKQAIWNVDPDVPVTISDYATLLAAQRNSRRFETLLLTGFAALGLLVAAIGVGSVAAHSVSARTREVGVHLALGAHPRHVLRLVIGQTLAGTVAGLVAGLGPAAFLTSFLANLAFEVQATDSRVHAAMAVLLLIGTAGAAWIPARRALNIDPAVTLRAE
jgi:putative ABC transport system permease protein